MEGNNSSGFENFQRQFNEEYAKVPEVTGRRLFRRRLMSSFAK